MAGIGRRAISQPRKRRRLVADKGYFVVYSIDERRFVVPLICLHTNIFRELFRMSEEEFGLPRDGPIVLPCDAAFLEYVIYLVQNQLSKNIQTALLLSLGSGN